ncbi:MAG: hypothetical protein R3C60_04050 [Parvularculaceae bacterium]
MTISASMPPGTGICHQVNLEYLAQTVWTADYKGETFAYPDTLVGTDNLRLWSMAFQFSAGAWAASKRKRCSASQFRYSFPEVIGFPSLRQAS